MSGNWRWVSKQALLLLHGESLAEHGGAEGIRDQGLLDSALARPLNVAADAQPATPSDIATLAASYGVGLARNHPFVDGNKRVAFLAVGLFLFLNGHRLQATQGEATLALFAVAAGDLTEEAFADWLRGHVVARA